MDCKESKEHSLYIINDLSLEEYKCVLKQLHLELLVIVKEIKRICENNKIKYFLIGGSLLGAIRHKGFIPWDDDLDIGMLRNDYERFINACKSELQDSFQLVTNEINSFGLPYLKIQLKNTVFREKNAPKYECGNGIFIDVFPIDRIPDGTFARKIHRVHSLVLRWALLLKSGFIFPDNTVSRTRLLASLYSFLFRRDYIIQRMNKTATRYNSSKTEYYYNTGSAYEYGREVFPSESLESDLQVLPFEGINLPCPNNPEKILESLYGNYMQLPPEEKRYNRHGVIEIQF